MKALPLVISLLITSGSVYSSPCFKKTLVEMTGKITGNYKYTRSSIEEIQVNGEHDNIFLNQNHSSIASPRGSCGPTCAINLFQEVMFDIKGKEGLFTPENLREVINHLFDLSSNTPIKTKSRLLGIYKDNPGFGQGHIVTNKISKNLIRPQKKVSKIIHFGVYKNGTRTEGHIILVKSIEKSRLEVVEPNFPMTKFGFKLSPIIINSNKKRFETFKLMPDKGHGYEDTFGGGHLIIDSVISVEY